MILGVNEKIMIREMKLEDLNDFFAYRSNPEITKYQGFDVKTKDECMDFIHSQKGKIFGKPGEWMQFSICQVGSNGIIGDCALCVLEEDDTAVEIGITISDMFQNKGYAKQAMKLLMKYIFIEKNYRRIVETADLENIACIRLLESLQFRKEGEFHENIFFKGKWGSEVQYAMLKSEYVKLI